MKKNDRKKVNIDKKQIKKQNITILQYHKPTTNIQQTRIMRKEERYKLKIEESAPSLQYQIKYKLY